MGTEYSELLNAIEELNQEDDTLPTNIEEARTLVLEDVETVKDLVITANLQTVIELLIENGFITRDEFNERTVQNFGEGVEELAQDYLNAAREKEGLDNEATN